MKWLFWILLVFSLDTCGKKQGEENLLLVKIHGLQVHDEGVTVLLKSEDDREVAITIGYYEAQALVMALQEKKPKRPLPHELLENLLEKIDGKVKRLVIHSLEDNIYYAYLFIETDKRIIALDCRPSDGMIIAIHLEVPIYVNPAIIKREKDISKIRETSFSK